MGAIGKSGASVNEKSSYTAKKKTRTERLVSRIVREIDDWVAMSSLDPKDPNDFEDINTWGDLMDALWMTSKEAKEDILEALNSDVWEKINRGKATDEDIKMQFDDDGEFETETGDFIKYGQVMKLVKKELVNKGYLKSAR